MRKEIADLALIRIESEAERESEMEAHFAERFVVLEEWWSGKWSENLFVSFHMFFSLDCNFGGSHTLHKVETGSAKGKQIQLLLNAGGPYRLLHVQMAEAVAQFRGYGTSKIKSVSASSVNRGVKSPSDISMISLD
ncbi:hypothetical protein Ahy_B06g085257 [Arachis hypogaea]|uniref:Uncharacterized protein n=1 Tax=Arachis hypogaea TaxID=3818 RepID=A0A444YU02_ARAHY|nr:hypothetical protein Ahy_B06g085257 [Arachis hypogaea]